MTGDTPIQFQKRSSDESVPDPVAASQAIRDEYYHPVIRGAVDTDSRVTRLLNTGWCFFPPQQIELNPNESPPVTPRAATKYMDIESRDTDDLLIVQLDLQWSVTVDAETPVLVVPWVGTIQTKLASQLITAADGHTPLKAPIATSEPITIEANKPLLQIIPIPEALLDAEWETGIPPEDFDIESR